MAFTGQLKPNEIFGSIFNMIISQEVLADNIYDTKATLADMSRVDGSLYGDTKLYYSTDVLGSIEWTNDSEAQDLLKLHRPKAPDCQPITIDQFRMIPVTVDNYMTKRAFSTEGAFSEFNSQMLSWIRDTKRVYDSTLFNTFVGTNTAEKTTENITIELPVQEPDAGRSPEQMEASNRLIAQTIAKAMADLLVEIEDVSRDLNDYGNLRSYNDEDLVFVWNSEWVNQINKLDVPMIFHKDIVDKFAQHTLPARFFGTVISSSGSAATNNSTVRSLVEKDYNTVAPSNSSYDPGLHIFPGDLIPEGKSYEANEAYTVDPNIVFKVYHKRSIPFMTGFETGTEFFNPRSLTETHYLIWGYNTLEHLKNYPFVTATAEYAQ